MGSCSKLGSLFLSLFLDALLSMHWFSGAVVAHGTTGDEIINW